MNTQNKTLLSLALLGTPNTGITLTYIIAQMDEDDLATKFREGDYDFEYDDLIETGFYKQADEYMRMEIERLCVPHRVLVGHSANIDGDEVIDCYELIELIKDSFDSEGVYMDIECSSREDLKVEKVYFVGNDNHDSLKDEDGNKYWDYFKYVAECSDVLPGLVA